MSGTDSLFISGETPTWHQHVAGLVVVDPSEVPGFGSARTRPRRMVGHAEFDIRRHLRDAVSASPPAAGAR